MPHDTAGTRINLQEVSTRNRTARHIVAGFASATPTLSEYWQHITTALADTPALAAEITRLSAEAAADRLDRADLLAACRATISADLDHERDPLCYLRDELAARGQLPGRSRRRA